MENNLKVIQLGQHFLIHGDCTSIHLSTLLNKLLNGEKIDLILTDPPYGVSYVENKLNSNLKHKKILNDDLNSEEYKSFTKNWLSPIKENLAEFNSFYIFNSDKMYIPLVNGIKESGYKYSQQLIWIKSQAVLGRLNYHMQHELIAFGWYKKHKFYKTNDKTILQCPKPLNNKDHPTIKPISLIRRLILNSTKVGDIIYDCFGGSGTTLLAAEQTKRRCIIVEHDKDYVDLIMKRYQKLTNINSNEKKITKNPIS